MKSKAATAELFFNKAVKAEDEGKLTTAERLYRRVIEINGYSSNACICLAGILEEQGRWQEAIEIARRYPTNRAYSSHALVIIGMSHRELNHLLLAERAFRQALAAEPSAGTWVFLSDALLYQGRKDESMDCLRSAIKLDPNYEEAHYNLGVAYRLRRQFVRAEIHLRRAVEIDPKYSIAYAELGWTIVCRRKNIDRGIRMLRKSIRLDPRYGWSRIYLANALWRKKQFKAAENQYRKAVEIWDDFSVPYWCYGSFLVWENLNPSLAETLLRKAVELDPGDAEANYNLGRALYNWDRKSEAVKFLRKAARQGRDKAANLLKLI